MEDKLNSQKLSIENDEFLKTIYEQSTVMYLQFVNIRFQVLGLLILNAVLFNFVYESCVLNKKYIFVSLISMFFTWAIFFLDKRNRYIFKRATSVANEIEKYYKIPEKMQLHQKDEKKEFLFSHSNIITIITVVISIFWLIVIFFPRFLIKS